MKTVSPSHAFQLKSRHVLIAVLLFIISYFALIFFSAGILSLCAYISFNLLSARVSFATLAISVGLMTFGIMFFLFLFKFILAKNIDQNPFRVQIYPHQHPALFELIDELTREIGTENPGKVYLRPEVNAAVFYDSSFWSLFIPVRKNLEIGLALVNTLSKAELKAVLAHEFGHFSQKSMRLGSYVYVLNKVIYNLVYERDRWDSWLESLAQTSGIFGFFMAGLYHFVELVRELLRMAYRLINRRYLAMSREMEFHADAISATVAGKDQAISALIKIESGQVAFDRVQSGLNELIQKGQYANNLFELQSLEIIRDKELARKRTNEATEPSIKLENNSANIRTRIRIPDEFASHPSLEERVQAMDTLDTTLTEPDQAEAWELFSAPMLTQQNMTLHYYETSGITLTELSQTGKEAYLNLRMLESATFDLNEFYKGFFDERHIFQTELTEEKQELPGGTWEKSLAEYYNFENRDLFAQFKCNMNDLAILKDIQSGQTKTEFFYFSGVRHESTQASELTQQFEAENGPLETRLRKLDRDALHLNRAIAQSISNEADQQLTEKWKNLFEQQENVVTSGKIFSTIVTLSNTRFRGKKGLEDMRNQLQKQEKEFREFLSKTGIAGRNDLPEEFRNYLKEYLNRSVGFIRVSTLNANDFQQLFQLVAEIHLYLSNQLRIALKAVTDFQIKLYDELRQIETNQGVANNSFSV